MTYVLLRSAGFNHTDALLVAAVDQGMDDSPQTVANGDVGPASGVYPNVDEEWMWHALDSAGKMTAKGIIAKKEELFSLALQQSGYRNKLILLGVFFITNRIPGHTAIIMEQGPCQTESEPPVV